MCSYYSVRLNTNNIQCFDFIRNILSLRIVYRNGFHRIIILYLIKIYKMQ